jgi:hypothetical protein
VPKIILIIYKPEVLGSLKGEFIMGEMLKNCKAKAIFMQGSH